MSKRKFSCSGCLLCAGLTLLILAVPFWYFCIKTPPLIISEETTYVTGPLTASGHIDYFKALEERIYPPELATDDNGFRVFTRLFGHLGDGEPNAKEHEHYEFYRLQKYEKLGLDPDVPPTLTLPPIPYRIYEEFYTAKEEPLKSRQLAAFSTAMTQPWTLEEFPMLADWVRDIDEPLDAIAEAIRKPVFCLPLLQSPESVQSGEPQNLIAILLPDVQYSRTIARHFQARATYRIATGDIDGAIEDKLTLHRLGRQLTHRGFLIQYLMGIAHEGMAIHIPVGANPEHPLTKEQILRLQSGLDALQPRAPMNEAYEMERYCGLDIVQALSREPSLSMRLDGNSVFFTRGLSDALLLWLVSMRAVSVDWNVVYRRMNAIYDAIQEPPPRTKYDSLIEEAKTGRWKNRFLQFWTSSGRGNACADLILDFFAPAYESFEEAIHRSECSENMQRLALAFHLYRFEHGTLPVENWAEAIMPYLGENAEKYFSCPSNPSPEGETTYALIQYGDAVAGSRLLLLERNEPVPFDQAMISADDAMELARVKMEVMEGECCGRVTRYERPVGGLKAHTGGANAVSLHGGVQFLSGYGNEEELLRLLGKRSQETEDRSQE